MRKTLLAGAVLLAAVLPSAATAAALPRVAYFKVEVRASQDINWKQHLKGPSCDGKGLYERWAQGRSILRLHSPGPVLTVAKRTPRGGVLFWFGNRPSGMPVSGWLRRTATDSGTNSAACPSPYSTRPDCGTRMYPASTRLALLYDTPESWQDYSDGPAPIVDVLHLRGPYVPEWQTGAHFLNCPGQDSDYQLGVSEPGQIAMEAGHAALSLDTLFGRREHFELTAREKVTWEPPRPENATGSSQVTTSFLWTVTFTRLARRPR